MSTPSERESVEVVADVLSRSPLWTPWHMAQVLLASDWLAARDAEQRARGGVEECRLAAASIETDIPPFGSVGEAEWCVQWLRDRAAALDAQAEAGGSDG